MLGLRFKPSDAFNLPQNNIKVLTMVSNVSPNLASIALISPLTIALISSWLSVPNAVLQTHPAVRSLQFCFPVWTTLSPAPSLPHFSSILKCHLISGAFPQKLPTNSIYTSPPVILSLSLVSLFSITQLTISVHLLIVFVLLQC